MPHEYEVLSTLRNHLLGYSTPTNLDGFFIEFCDWVIREWTHRASLCLAIAPIVRKNLDVPPRVKISIKDPACSYRSFINSHDNHSFPNTFTMEKKLYEFFHETMRLRALVYLEGAYPELHADSFWTRIFNEEFNGEDDRYAAEDITELFGFYAIAAAPYICPPQPTAQSRYADWTLNDFKTAAGLVRGLGGEGLSRVARATGKLLVLHQGSSQKRSVKLPLSQKGGIA